MARYLAEAGAVELEETPHPDWADAIDQQAVAGMPFVNEVAFRHRASRTLLSCDLAFHVGPEAPALTRMSFRMMGAYGRLDTTLLEKILTWITSAPEGQVLVIKMKTIEEPFVPYPSFVSRDILQGKEPPQVL